LPVPTTQCRCLETMGRACSLQRRRGLSVLRRPARGPWRFNPSSGRLGHAFEAAAASPSSRVRLGSRTAKLMSIPASQYFVEFLSWSRLSPSVNRCQKNTMHGWPNLECQMPEVSTRQRRASWASHPVSAVAPLRSCRLLAQPSSPNHSVKGTSRKRAAPYVER
jgi:hypothetical protein